MAIAGSRSATRAFAYSAPRPCISQGTPSDGKSVGIRLFIAPRLLFIAAVAASTWRSRFAGSAMWVPRLTIVIVAWLFDAVSPFARVETGTPATIDLRGSGPCFRKLRRSAPLHTISTASFRLALWRRRTALTCASGRLRVANTRLSETVVFRRVRGASARLLTLWVGARAARPRSRALTASKVSPAVSPAFWPASIDSTPTVCGIALTAVTTRSNWFASAPRSMSAKPSGRFTGADSPACLVGGGTARGTGLRSRIA